MNAHEYTAFQNTANALSMKIVLSGRLTAGPEWRFYHHPAPANRLYFIYRGEGYIGNARMKKRFSNDLIMLTTVNSFFDYVCESHLEKLYFHFRLELFPGRDVFDGVNSCLTRTGDRAFFETLAAKAAGKHMSDMLEAKAMLLSAIAPFISDNTDTMKERIRVGEKYRRLLSAIDERCSLSMTPHSLAALAGMAGSTLVKNFRRDVGVSLKHYIMERIASRAKDEVHGTEKKIKDIAHDLGFSDEFYFSRFFKRYAGLSPADYRKANVLR